LEGDAAESSSLDVDGKDHAMPYTGDAENAMLTAFAKKEAPTVSPTFVGAFKALTAITGWTGATTILTHAAHGLVDKDLVVLNSFTGGTGLVAKRWYYAKKVGVNEIELYDVYALTGTAVSMVSVTEASISKLEEATGGSPAYARVACVYAAAANRKTVDATEHEVNMAAGQVVDFVGYFSAVSGAGTTLAGAEVTKETFASQGILKVKEGLLDLAAAA
jgi:hypothetical protein